MTKLLNLRMTLALSIAVALISVEVDAFSWRIAKSRSFFDVSGQTTALATAQIGPVILRASWPSTPAVAAEFRARQAAQPAQPDAPA